MNQATSQAANQLWNILDGVLDAIWGLPATGLIHGTILAALTALAGATLLRRASPALLAALWTVVLLKFVIPLGPALPVSLSGLVEAMLAGAEGGADANVAAMAVSAHGGARSTGAVLWLLAVSGEALADAQLAAFQRDPANRGQVCDTGLWRTSRHPNYFFEWLTWVAYALFALASPWGWLGLIGPACILWLLLRVTGLPTTEAQSLRSRGDAYRRYQARTSAFVPWFPKTR